MITAFLAAMMATRLEQRLQRIRLLDKVMSEDLTMPLSNQLPLLHDKNGHVIVREALLAQQRVHSTLPNGSSVNSNL